MVAFFDAVVFKLFTTHDTNLGASVFAAQWAILSPNSQICTHSPSHTLLDVLVHELAVELAPERVVDEVGLLLLWRRPRAVLEDDVVVPAPLHPHICLFSGARVPGLQHISKLRKIIAITKRDN